MLVQHPSVSADGVAPSSVWGKKMRSELHDVSSASTRARSPEELMRAYAEAVKLHPFRHNAHSLCDIYADTVLRDGNGTVVAVLIRGGLPPHAAAAAATVLRGAATRTTLRMNIYGGEAPHSGIAGYFDYRGTPIEHKYRKTAFTYENADAWPGVFAMVDYVSALYKRALPQCWHAQDAAIPDVVRIHGSPFSTLTINSRFRTASHTDAGDFDAGYGCLACLEGNFTGMCLTLDDFRVNVTLQPCDVLLFDTHHFHSNTEVELDDVTAPWSRLTCVFYYRAALGEAAAYATYERRLLAAQRALTEAATAAAVAATVVAATRTRKGARARLTIRQRRTQPARATTARQTADTSARDGNDNGGSRGGARMSSKRAAATAVAKIQTCATRATTTAAAATMTTTTTTMATLDVKDGVLVDAAVHAAVRRCRAIVVKPNGENANKPSVVHPLELTPFAVLATLRCCAHCAGTSLRVHAWLLHRAHAAAALFGEELQTTDGIVARREAELILANTTPDMHTTPIRGFAQGEATLRAAAAKQQYLELGHLSRCLGDELCDIWRLARERWLSLLREDWARLRARAPGRSNFAWNNRSAMNAAFFDLCEVARQVMLVLLSKESATASEEQAFWAIFAAHLCRACSEEVGMPAEAMPMHKLNVKVKDYQFGGTRYFKDMPAEEQQRRRERRARVEQARRRQCQRPSATATRRGHDGDDDDDKPADAGEALASDAHDIHARQWLTSDVFDYQSEDAVVDYASHGWLTPDEHARRCVDEVPVTVPSASAVATAHNALYATHAGERALVEVLVVLPAPPQTNAASSTSSEDVGDMGVTKTHRDSDESRRLLCSRAAQRLRQRGCCNHALPATRSEDGLVVTFAYAGNEPGRTFDFVVAQHVLAGMSGDAQARAYVQQLRRRTRGCVLIAETDLQCRYHYMLKDSVREAYLAVATDCYQQLLRAKYGYANAMVRTKATLEAMAAPHCLARYKFDGSALNTMILLIAGDGAAA